MKKLAIISTHPIQYNAPFFKLLTQRGIVDLHVFYTWEQAKTSVYDVDFNRVITWDIPLLDGYSFSFVKNVSKDPGLHHLRGIDNPTLLEDIEAYNPDALIVFGWNFKSHLQAIRYFYKKIPIIFRGDSTLLDDVPGLKSTVRKFFLTWVYSHVNKALYVGKRNKEYFLNNGLKLAQLIFAPHAVDICRFRAQSSITTSKKKELTRTSLGITEEELVFLFAGKLEEKKNPFLLINSFRRLRNQNSHLVIVGNGLLEESLKRECSNDATIHFLDFQNQMAMPLVYKLADVFVLPSAGPGETWGLAINEAMACAKAVLVSDKCGCAEDLVEDNINGYIFKSGNEDELLAKLNAFTVMEREDIHQMGLASYSKIEKWSFESVCGSIEDLMSESNI